MSDTKNPAQELRSVYELANWGAHVLEKAGLHYGHGTDNPADEALQLVLHAAGLDYNADESQLNEGLPDSARQEAIRLIERRIVERKPAPYLTGIAWFGGLKFRVDERVLIPRSSIIELIENHFQPWIEEDEAPARILDLCTGSGCLAIACAYAFPESQVDATDLSADALDVAQLNVEGHGLVRRVHLIESDVFDGLEDSRYGLIISNPPYVGAEEMASLPAEYRHEPSLGLQAEDEGLAVVGRILDEAADHLEDDGLLVVEVGNSEDLVMQRWPDLPVIWVEFEHSEGGVFIIGAGDLRAWNERH